MLQILPNRTKMKTTLINNTLFILFISLCTLIDFAYCFNFRSITRSTTSSVINLRTSYTFAFDRQTNNNGVSQPWPTQLVPSTGIISVQFPTDYVLTGVQTCDSITIIAGSPSTQTYTPTGYTCTLSGNRIQFVGALTSLGDLAIQKVTVSYGNILNPSPAIRTKQFTGYVGNDVAVPSGTTLQLVAATFTACQITFGNGAYVNQTSPAILTITNLNQLNSSSIIRVGFPSTTRYWKNDISKTILPIVQGTMGCTPLLSVQSSIACSGNFTAFTVQASQIFSTGIASGTKISFQIQNFLSPSTLQPADDIKITSLTSNYQVDTCTVSVSGLKPQLFELLQIYAIDSSMKVNEKVALAINMTLIDTIDESDTFRITLPSVLTVAYDSLTSSASQVTLTGISGQILSISQNTNFQVQLFKDGFFVISLYYVYAPPSTKQTDVIKVQILRNGYQKMIGTTTIKAVQSTLTATVTPNSLAVNDKTSYVFKITLQDKLSSTGWLEIAFPAQISLPALFPTVSAVGTSTGVKSTPTVTIDQVNNKIIITSMNSSSGFIAVQTITLTAGLITNPGINKKTSQFSINSYYQTGSDYLVAKGTFQGFTPTPGILKSSQISITKTSDIVLAQSVQYTFNFLTTYAIPQNGIVQIEIPNDIKIDLNNLQTNCFQKVNSTGSKISATCEGTLNLVTNKYLITVKSLALTGSLSQNSTISISLQNICTNPDTTRNILGFTIGTYSTDGYLIQSATTGISTRASTPSQCLSINILRSSKKNSDITNFTIQLRQTSDLIASSFLVITIPVKLQLSANSFCSDLTGTTNLTCTFASNLVTVKLPSSLTVNMTKFGVVITNVLNPSSFQPITDQFSLLTKTPDNINSYCQYQGVVSALQNDVASSFSSIAGVFTPRMFYELTSLIVTFKPSTRVIPSYVIVSLATQLDAGTLTCSYQGIVGGACVQTFSNTIKITGTFTQNQMQFSIGGITTPKFKSTTSQFSSVSSFSSADYKIDQSINLIQFQVKCVLPCKTCDDTNLSACLSCYQDSAISTQTYYLSSQKKCFSVCPDSFYEDASTLKCETCDTKCKTCEVTSINCTSCNTNSTTPYFNFTTTTSTGTCMTNCPTFYYPNTAGLCVLCQTPCKDCSSKTTCISCLSTFYMTNGLCKSTCPTGTTIANNVTNKCDTCDSVCASCSLTVSNCTSCSADSASYNNSCVSICPPPLVIKNGNCSTCDTLCKQCSLKSSNCTKCDTSSSFPYLYSSTCLPNCPQTYYNDLINGICVLCSTLNIGCVNCSSMSTCKSCDTGFIFLNNKCYNTTPTGYYNDNGIAKPCSGDCATCIDLAAKCTSCKTLNLDGNTCISPCPNIKVPQNKICIPCQSPCLTCSNLKTNCTTCLPDLVPDVFLNNFYCTETCPDYTYPNQTTNLCVLCKTPCLKCIGQTECTSCVNGKFLLGTQCLTDCPTGYIGLNKICTQCTPPCEACEISTTRCLTCKPSFYLYNSSSPTCVNDCKTVGLYNDVSTQKCTGCKLPCLTCQNTSDTCLSCTSTLLLFQNDCLDTCPQNYFKLSDKCASCPIECKTCTSLSVCQSCKLSYYLHLSSCIDTCPASYPVITISGSCSKCSDTACDVCSDKDYCTLCLVPYFLQFGKCLQRCPTSYKQSINNQTNIRECVYDPTVNNTYTTNTTNTTTNQTQVTLTQTLKSGGNLFPVPFTIAAMFIGIATIMSKFQNRFTFVSGVLYSLFGVLEWGAVGLVLWFFYDQYGWQKIQFYVIGGSFVFLYLLNILGILIQNIYLMGDQCFKKWLSLGSNRCFYYFSSIISLVATHKFKHFMFCKMFNFEFTKGKLDSVQQFRYFNFFSFLSFISSAGVLFGLGLIYVTYTLTTNQQLMAYIDATILTVINIILAILNSRKQSDYFEEKTQEGLIVGKRIDDLDQMLYGGFMPMTTQQKFDHYQTTGLKLLPTSAGQHYRQVSEYSEDSVRNMSIQCEGILGQQSRITHLHSQDISDFDFVQKRQVSVQFDQPPVSVNDQSIDMSVPVMHQISIQMDHIEQNQISIQVEKQNHEISIQYAPNVYDQQQGMSREQADMQIQATPNQGEISIQYSAKPMFLNVDQDYISGGEEDFEESIQSREQTVKSLSIISQSNNNIQQSNINLNSYRNSSLAIKQPDQKLYAELELDVQQKLRRIEVKREQERKEEMFEENQQIIQNFKKKIPNNAIIHTHQVQISNFVDNQDWRGNQEGNTRFQSTQSRVQVVNSSENEADRTQVEIVQMLSQVKQGRKFNVEHQDQLQDSKQISVNITQELRPLQQKDYQSKGKDPRINFSKKDQNIDMEYDDYEYSNDEDVSQRIIQNKYSKEYKEHKRQNSCSKISGRPHKYQSNRIQSEHDNELLDSSKDADFTLDIINGPIQPSTIINRVNNMTLMQPQARTSQLNQEQLYQVNQFSQDYSKSISTNVRTAQNWKPPRPSQGVNASKNINSNSNIFRSREQQLLDTSQEKSLNQNQQNSAEYNAKTNLTQFLQRKARNLRSATLNRNSDELPHNSNQLQEYQDPSDDEDYQNQNQNRQKQQPLPPPQNQLHQYQNQYQNQYENEQLEFGQSQKVLVSPLETQQVSSKLVQVRQSRALPQGVNNKNNIKFRTNSRKKLTPNKNKSMGPRRESNKLVSREKVMYNQLLKPSTSIPNRNLTKQLQKQQKKAQNRKKDLQLMQGMLERPSNNSRRGYLKQQQQDNKRSSVQKIYLNKPGYHMKQK